MTKDDAKKMRENKDCRACFNSPTARGDDPCCRCWRQVAEHPLWRPADMFEILEQTLANKPEEPRPMTAELAIIVLENRRENIVRRDQNSDSDTRNFDALCYAIDAIRREEIRIRRDRT